MFTAKNIKNVGIITIIIAAIVGIYFPSRHARRYDCVKQESILRTLKFEWRQNDNLPNCNYHDIIFNAENETEVTDITKDRQYLSPNLGGDYKPSHCNPLINSAIIIPYRNREEHLKIFLSYMHNFLQKQNIYYTIFVVDQNNHQLFNRAKLLNIGAKIAMEKGFSCLILHDVDLIPLNYGNIYGCSKNPRHMSSSLDTFRYNLPYLTLFGGAVAILSEHFKKINGMSNLFVGWGGEDDDFYRRLLEIDLKPCRFCPPISKYTMISHKKNRNTSENRFNLLEESPGRRYFDGLNTLNDSYTIELKPLYTHVVVS